MPYLSLKTRILNPQPPISSNPWILDRKPIGRNIFEYPDSIFSAEISNLLGDKSR